MDHKHDTLTLYTCQTDAVLDALKQNGVCFSKAEYVRKKYQESAQVFLTAYDWFSREAARIVPKPEGAEYPYWAFLDANSLEQSGGSNLLTLEVPCCEAVFFDVYDWNRIMQHRFLGEDAAQEAAFGEALAQRGIREYDVMLQNFYPQEKQQIQQSWKRLFRHHERIQAGDLSGVGRVQAGLWQIKKEWVR